LDTLPEVQQQNTHHDPGAYGTGRFSAVLPKCRYTCVIRFMDGKLEETVPEKA